MTLQKAIEILEFEEKATLPPRNDDFWDSIRLLIEAGKRIDRQRHLTIPINQPPLPGEDIV